MQDSKAVLITKEETVAPKNRGPGEGNGKEKSQDQEQGASRAEAVGQSAGKEGQDGVARASCRKIIARPLMDPLKELREIAIRRS